MEDESVTIESNLTSTVGNVLLSETNDRTDANDSIPTSSTDAASTYSPKCLNATDDPISSTSSELSEKQKILDAEVKSKAMDVSKGLLGGDGDVDLLDMNMSHVSAEPIIEDVEDIVQDLENLLGEPEPFNEFSTRRKESQEKLREARLEDPHTFSGEKIDNIQNDLEASLENLLEVQNVIENAVDVFQEKSTNPEDTHMGDIDCVVTNNELEKNSLPEISSEVVTEKSTYEKEEIVEDSSHSNKITEKEASDEKEVETTNVQEERDVLDHMNPVESLENEVEETVKQDLEKTETVAEEQAVTGDVPEDENLEEADESMVEIAENVKPIDDSEKSVIPEAPVEISEEPEAQKLQKCEAESLKELPENEIRENSVEEEEKSAEINEIDNAETVRVVESSVGENDVKECKQEEVGEEREKQEDVVEEQLKALVEEEIKESRPEEVAEEQSESPVAEEIEESSQGDVVEEQREPLVVEESIQEDLEEEQMEPLVIEGSSQEDVIEEQMEALVVEKNVQEDVEDEQMEPVVVGETEENSQEDVVEKQSEAVVEEEIQESIQEDAVMAPSEPSVEGEIKEDQVEKQMESSAAEELKEDLVEKQIEPSATKEMGDLVAKEIESSAEEIKESSQDVGVKLTESLVAEENEEPFVEEVEENIQGGVVEKQSEPLAEEEIEESGQEVKEPSGSTVEENTTEQCIQGDSGDVKEPSIEECTKEDPPDEVVEIPESATAEKEVVEVGELAEPSVEENELKQRSSREEVEESDEVVELPKPPPDDQSGKDNLEPAGKEEEVVEDVESVSAVVDTETVEEMEVTEETTGPIEEVNDSRAPDEVRVTESTPETEATGEIEKPVAVVEEASEEKISTAENELVEIPEETESESLVEVPKEDPTEGVVEMPEGVVDLVQSIEVQNDLEEIKTDIQIEPEVETVPDSSIEKIEEIIQEKTSQLNNEVIEIQDEEVSTLDTEGLVPVVEEPVVKKTVVYEHDCHKKATKVETQNKLEEVKIVIEDSSSSDEYIETSSSQERIEKDDSNSSVNEVLEIVQKRSLSQLAKADEVEVIEDQTTAAVQSILDNMLEDNKNVEMVTEKEEAVLVHSSYSSYELQKAVQQIQDITQTTVDLDEYITNTEKPKEQKLVQVVEVESTENAIKDAEIFEVEEVKVPTPEPSVEEEKRSEEVVEEVQEVVKRPEVPMVQPSIDLSEESSTEESSDDDKAREVVTSSVQETKTPPSPQKEIKKVVVRETRHSSRINDKSKLKENVSEPLSINVGENEEKNSSPKIIIKPIKEGDGEEKEEHKGSLKITITKQSDNTHSILKICSPDSQQSVNDVPKLVIKTSEVDQHSPKISTRSAKQGVAANSNQRSGSPRITIKPIVKPDVKEATSPLKITIKPMGKPEEFSKQQQQRHSPKLSKNKADDDHYDYGTRSKVLKSSENSEVHSPKVTIKPILKPEEVEPVTAPKITIKPIEKPEEAKVSPKITIKPVVRQETDGDVEDEVKERIVLKINKGTIPSKEVEKSGRKREHEEDKSEKLAKIKLKFSKGGDARIVHDEKRKRMHEGDAEKTKRQRVNDSDEDVTIIETRQSPIVISEDSRSQDSVIVVEEGKEAKEQGVVSTTPSTPTPKRRGRPRKVPLVAREEFQKEEKVEAPSPVVEKPPAETETSGRPKRSCRGQSVRDTLGMKPRKPKSPAKPRGGKRGGKAVVTPRTSKEFEGEASLTEGAAGPDGILKIAEDKPPVLELKGLLEAAKDQNIIEVIEIDSPEDSQDVSQGKVVLKGDVGETEAVGKSRDVKEDNVGKDDVDVSKDTSELGGVDADVEMQPPTPVLAPPLCDSSTMDLSHSTDIAMFEEETRMSADANSRAQTPAKQVVSSDVVVEESQSSMQSTATTESGKISRRSRLEVHQDIDNGITADQLNEYYWGGNGPFMLQEQVAQFLGIKSFKRKYPNIPRRTVEMQERDYIRENALASESMCDLGLTAVNSADILDIMYTDFQEKYEEYCKIQRDKQAKDLLNKQRALSLQAGQEKNKLDIVEQAVHSAAAYNANFNKVRREQRKACMDLQTMNVHYPKGRMKQANVSKIGHYPVALVPGQFTDYYREFTPTELNHLPLNTMLYTELHKILPESDSDSDSSGSDSDDGSSSSSDSDSSCGDSCKMCNSSEKRSVTPRKSPIHAGV